jgi:hypothetical protein
METLFLLFLIWSLLARLDAIQKELDRRREEEWDAPPDDDDYYDDSYDDYDCYNYWEG